MRPIRLKTLSQTGLLWFAQALVACLQLFFRVWEFFAFGWRRESLRELREKLDGAARERDEIISKIKGSKGRPSDESLEAVYAMLDRHSTAEERERNQAELGSLRTMRAEASALKAIGQQAGADQAAVIVGYREYLREHPDSALGYSRLGMALKKVNDLDGSMVAYQESLRLSERPSVAEAMAYLNIGQVLHEQGKLQEAVSEYHRVIDNPALDLGLMRCQAYLHLGNTLHAQGDHAGARSAWKMSVKLDTTGVIAKPAREMLKSAR